MKPDLGLILRNLGAPWSWWVLGKEIPKMFFTEASGGNEVVENENCWGTKVVTCKLHGMASFWKPRHSNVASFIIFSDCWAHLNKKYQGPPQKQVWYAPGRELELFMYPILWQVSFRMKYDNGHAKAHQEIVSADICDHMSFWLSHCLLKSWVSPWAKCSEQMLYFCSKVCRSRCSATTDLKADWGCYDCWAAPLELAKTCASWRTQIL